MAFKNSLDGTFGYNTDELLHQLAWFVSHQLLEMILQEWKFPVTTGLHLMPAANKLLCQTVVFIESPANSNLLPPIRVLEALWIRHTAFWFACLLYLDTRWWILDVIWPRQALLHVLHRICRTHLRMLLLQEFKHPTCSHGGTWMR